VAVVAQQQYGAGAARIGYLSAPMRCNSRRSQINMSVLEVSGPGSMLISSDQKGTYPEPLVSCGTLLRYITIAGHDTLGLLSFA
jgi:hypothetical protein